jgi:hypothetical protein
VLNNKNIIFRFTDFEGSVRRPEESEWEPIQFLLPNNKNEHFISIKIK